MENEGTYYVVEYYSTKTGHGELGIGEDIDQMISKAIKLHKDKDSEDIIYIGVIGDGPKFAVIRCDITYLKKHLNPLDFNDKRGFKNFMKVATKVNKTGKPLKGRFDS